MTKEEAIEEVKSAFDAWEYQYDTGDDWSKAHKARDMAIKALEQTACEDWHDVPSDVIKNPLFDLCKSCGTKGCLFQSGIQREKCEFYIHEREGKE